MLYKYYRKVHLLGYDMVDLCALKSWRDGQLNLAHGTETKKQGKLKTKTG